MSEQINDSKTHKKVCCHLEKTDIIFFVGAFWLDELVIDQAIVKSGRKYEICQWNDRPNMSYVNQKSYRGWRLILLCSQTLTLIIHSKLEYHYSKRHMKHKSELRFDINIEFRVTLSLDNITCDKRGGASIWLGGSVELSSTKNCTIFT